MLAKKPDPEYTSSEYTVADGALVADGTGYMLKHPFVNHHLQKVLARWAYRLCTQRWVSSSWASRWRTMATSSARTGRCSGSDWIPKDRAIASVPSRHGLVVRYPIRRRKILLPFENLSVTKSRACWPGGTYRKRRLPYSDEQVAAVMDEQLQLERHVDLAFQKQRFLHETGHGGTQTLLDTS